MSVTTFTYLEQQIINVIKRFKFEELESSVMPVFPEISWTNVKSELVKCHETFTSANVAKVVKKIITEIKLSDKVVKDRLLTLKLIDISWHSRRLTWYGYTSINSIGSAKSFMNRDIQKKMQDYFYTLNLKINVKVNTHCGITYIALFKNQEKRKMNITSTYLALFAGQKYFFSTNRRVSSDISNALITHLGCTRLKRLKLTGRDLRSLSKLCWKKMEGALNCDHIDSALEYKDAAPDIKKTGIDFTQQKQRKKYSEMCFGDDPAVLESLVINGPSAPVAHEDIRNQLPDESIRLKWEFRSHDIVDCLKKLIVRRVLVTPLPDYISNLMVLGKNEITLKHN